MLAEKLVALFICSQGMGEIDDLDYKNLLRSIKNNDLKEYHLDDKDVLIVAGVCCKTFDRNSKTMEPLAVLNDVFGTPLKALSEMNRIIKLMEKGILVNSNRCLFSGEEDRAQIFQRKSQLIEGQIALSDKFLRFIFNETDNRKKSLLTGYQSNDEFLEDIFTYISLIEEDNLPEAYRGISQDGLKGEGLLNRIEKRIRKTTITLPFVDVVKEFKLNRKEQVIIMYLLKAGINCQATPIIEICRMISSGFLNQLRIRECFEPQSPLVNNSIVEIGTGADVFSVFEEVTLAPSFVNRLLGKDIKITSRSLDSILKNEPMFELIEPAQTLEQVIFADEIKLPLLAVIQTHKSDIGRTLKRWGFETQITKSEGIKILLAGAPGTGKTFCAGAIAKHLQKKMITTDISKVLDKYVGESEKRIRHIFDVYRQICEQIDNPPVLLLNEADQFLCRRISSVNHSVDHMNNRMQNIILEAMENIRGILICTTNLVDNFDEAYSRRFSLKFVLPRPGVTEREKLWRLHLPDKLPGKSNIDCRYLAESYEITGGQISLIVKNAAVQAATRPESERILTMTDLIYYCELEMGSNFEAHTKKIGFGRPS